jgi:hypothetical protein
MVTGLEELYLRERVGWNQASGPVHEPSAAARALLVTACARMDSRRRAGSLCGQIWRGMLVAGWMC